VIFRKPRKPHPTPQPDIPEGLWIKCPGCKELIYRLQLEENLWVCPQCGLHFRIPPDAYIQFLFDGGIPEDILGMNLYAEDPLEFPQYQEKLERARKRTGQPDAALVYTGKIGGIPVVLFATDFRVLAGSMGSVVGELFVRGARLAIERKTPFLALTSSGGGARMQEGILALMQMAKTTVAVNELQDAGILYINLLTDPTMGGVMASFAALGDLLIAEPGALLGFAGPRVIQQTIRQKLPPGFQRAEFLLEHGLVDLVVPRKELKSTLELILRLLWGENHG